MKTTRIFQSLPLIPKIAFAIVAMAAAHLPASAQSFVMDVNNATPAGATTENWNGAMLFYGTGNWTATLNMPAGTYHVTADRWTREDNANFSFNLFVNGTQRILDYATHALGGENEQLVSLEYLGYITTDGSPVTIKLQQNQTNLWGGRVESLTFTLTDDVYFDENTPDLIVDNVAAMGLEPPTTPSGFTTTLKNSDGINGVQLMYGQSPTPGSMAGTVMLDVGQTYAVYASRQVHMTHPADRLSYEVALDFNYFATVSGQAVNVPSDAVEETYLGNFTATNAITNVMLYNAGQYEGRTDYLRFVAVPEPSSVALLSAAGLMGVFFVRRRKAKLVA